ncbi:non-ribosomal peptide synthetase, partial [Snuella sedimenti]
IASDGWSLPILVKELETIYTQKLSGQTIALPELTVQYADYSIWQRNYLSGETLQKKISYWRESLQNSIPLELPIDFTRPAVQSTEGKIYNFSLDKTVTEALNAISQKNGATLYMTLLSIYKVFLYRYTGQTDISIGTPIANRGQKEIEGLIGFFVNTIVLRDEIEADIDFTTLLSQVKETCLNAYEHQDVPFEQIVDDLELERDQSRTPLFQTLFILQNNEEIEGFTLGKSSATTVRTKHTTAKFDLTFSLRETTDGILLDIEYVTDLFREETIARMARHFANIAESIAYDTTQALEVIEMLDTSEKVHLLETFNNTTVDYPVDKTLVDLFEVQAKKTPGSTAVVYEGKELSYAELDERSNQLARYLRDCGVRPDALVGICLDRSLEMIIGILGILKSGGAYVPIDPDYPRERIDYMLDDGAIDLILSMESSADALKEREDISVLLLDSSWDIVSKYPKRKLSSVLSPDNLAYIIYTSGSTGRPKGVLITHENVVRLFYNDTSLFDFNENDVWSMFHSFSFDFSVWEMYGALLFGGKLVVVPKSYTKDPELFGSLLANEGVTILNQTPSSFSVLQERVLQNNPDLQVRYVIFGGEALHPQIVKDWKERYTACKMVNMYGITETTVHVTYKEITEKEIASNQSNIGVPIPTLGCVILDDSQKLVPTGVQGELYVTGAGLARGYLNREDLTKERFVTLEIGNESRRYYRSGDLVKINTDGELEYLGRKDDQVKIRGYRIELGEITAALDQIEGIKQSVVLAKEDVGGNKRLVGYVVVEGAFDKDKVQEILKNSLPEYMVPMVWVGMESMPLTSSGKLDKRGLPDPDGSQLLTQEYVAPRSEIEEQLAGIWEELLGLDRVGVYDNFFELGGHSLLVVQFISRLQKLGYHIAVKDIFTNPTIAAIIGKVLDETLVYKVPSNGITVSSTRITPSMVPLLDLEQEELDVIVKAIPGGVSNIQDMYPLSPLQAGIHFHYLMSDSGQGDPYVLSNLITFSDTEKRSSFIEALQFVVNRHDVLRTCILSTGLSSAVQVVLRSAKLEFEVLDFDGSEDILSELQLLTAPGTQRMDISKGPLLKLRVVDDVINGAYYLQVNLHHLVMDHLGMEKIISEVTMYLSGKGSTLPTPVLYREFIGHTLHMQFINDGESYFRTLLGSIETPTYPFDLSNTLETGGGIEESHRVLPTGLSLELREVCSSMGIRPAVLFHAAYGIVVGRCSNTDHVIFGSLFSGRLQGSVGSADSLGLFINTLPIFLKLEGSVKDYLYDVKLVLEELLPYEQTPLSSIHDWSGVSNEVPLFSALFNYRHSDHVSEATNEDSMGLGISNIEYYERTNYPFNISVDDFGDDFKLTVQVDRAIESDRILAYMEQALVGLIDGVKAIDIKVENVNILTREEKTDLLDVFSGTTVDYPVDKTLVDLFENQVNKTSEAIALVYKEKQLTYKELDELSNQLAHYLVANYTIAIENSIAVILERSDWLIISFLAILKAGGTYVPIDPSYPEVRKKYILNDSGSIFSIDDAFIRMFKKLRTEYTTSVINSNIQAENLAYIIYTSGSTGKPKGVLIEHRSIINTILSQIEVFSIDSESHCLQFASQSFDASISEIFTALLKGASLHIIEEEKKLDVLFFKEFIRNNSITVATLPPAFLQLLDVEDLQGFSTLVTAGEAISVTLAKDFANEYNYINAYGPTEASICATTFHGVIESFVPIGKPIHNIQIYILNEANELLPIGVVGQLCIGGKGVARGYLNKETLTQEKFIDNPFKEGERIYKTGDLARCLPDGNIEFLGRKDDQVKVRGYRIELGEVENALRSLLSVYQSCVLAKTDTFGNKRLVGYVVPHEAFNKEAIQKELKEILPEYMVPTLWIVLDEMPVTSNGKIARKLLPNPEDSELCSREYVAPRSEVEEKLVVIWQKLLDVEKIGIHDNFFELGGHSLLATRLVAMIHKELKIEIFIQEIFEFSTIEEMSSYINYKVVNFTDAVDDYSMSVDI